MGVRTMNKLLILIALLGLSACSNRAIYENIRIQQQNDCLKEPPGQYEACVERSEKSYEEYRRERERALEEPADGLESGADAPNRENDP